MNDITTKETTTLKGEVVALEHAKNMMQSIDNIINNAPNSSAEEFDEFIRTLENSLATNPINFISGCVDDVLEKVSSLRNYNTTREELVKTVSILRVALMSWIEKEENRRLDIEAIRRVGKMMSENPEALYNAIFLKRE